MIEKFKRATNMSFQDKVVWITGASSGIGEGVAYALAKQGAKLILSARRVDALEMVRAKCAAGEATNGPATVPYILPLDISDLDALPAKAKEAHALFGHIDILINNAGIGSRGYVLDTDMAVQQRVMQVNYFGQIALTKAVLPYMIEQQKTGRFPVRTHCRRQFAGGKIAGAGTFGVLRVETCTAWLF
jgi:NAD(P)-dependent dehydrogenase (short-subunit alcohol dehydrogenase family)